MKKRTKKMVAPIIIAGLTVAYYVGFAVLCLVIEEIPFALKIIFGVIPLLLSGVCIFVLAERIKEIRSGEEDDLSNY